MKIKLQKLLLTLSAAFFVVAASAQVTTSSLGGVVNDAKGEALPGATVLAVHQPTGAQFYAITDAKGFYKLNNVTAGGPYKVTFSCLGYGEKVFEGVTLALSDNAIINVDMSEESMSLDEAVISAEGRNSNMRTDRAGSVTALGSKEIASLPTIDRSLNDILNLTPQAYVSGGKASIGGGNYRQSYVTVDGAAFNNAFGIGSNLPAGGAPISMDALDQIAITITPFDVRQSGFVGGGINATTKSGTNEIKATAYTFFKNQDMQGYKVGDKEFTKNDSRYLMYGVTVGGPIIKDKLFLFVSAEFDRSITPGPTRTFSHMKDDGTGTLVPDGTVYSDFSDGVARPSYIVLDALRDYMKDNYGYDTGVYSGYSQESPGHKLLARVDWNINPEHKLNVRFSHTSNRSAGSPSSSLSGFADSSFVTNIGGPTSMYSSYFKNARYTTYDDFTSVAGELNSRFLGGRLNNVLRGTYSYQNYHREQDGGYFPGINIAVKGTGTDDKYYMYNVMGYETYTAGNLRQVHTALVTDELSYTLGVHNMLLGAQFEYNHTKNGYQTLGGGSFAFMFDSEQALYDAIRNKTLFDDPRQFGVTHGNNTSLSQEYPTFEYGQASLYLQDEMHINKNLRVTAGLRFELPFYPDMSYNDNPYVTRATFASTPTNESGKYDPTKLPDAKLMVSPRVGFNWDILGNRKVVMRGGTGIFTGRIPFVYIIAQGGNSGVLQTPIARKKGDGVLPSMPVGTNVTYDYLVGQLYPNGYTPEIPKSLSQLTLIDPALKNPQQWKSSLAFDFELPAGFAATLEGMYSKDINPMSFTNVGLKAPTSRLEVPDISARPYYNNGYYNNDMQNVFVVNNVTDPKYWGHFLSLTATLEKKFWKGLSGSVSYTYSEAKVINDGLSDQVSSAWKNLVSKRGTNNHELGNANYVMPHRLLGHITYARDYAKYFGSSISLFYYGGPTTRGSYDYTTNVYNDGGYAYSLMDIPTLEDLRSDAGVWGEGNWKFKANGEYTAAQQAEDLWNYIQQDKYLKKHTGEVADRNTLIGPWVHRFDLKFNQNFYFFTGKNNHKHTVQLGLDIKNVANLLNSNWGNSWSICASSYGNAQPLNLTNPKDVYVDGAKPVFQFQKNGNEVLKSTFYKSISSASTWEMIVSARYIF